MTYVSLGRKTGILALISLLVLVSLLFTSASVQAQEVTISGFELDAEDGDVEVEIVEVDTKDEEDVDSVINDINLMIDTENNGSTTENSVDDEYLELTYEDIEEFNAFLETYICRVTNEIENPFVKLTFDEANTQVNAHHYSIVFDELYVGDEDSDLLIHDDDIVPIFSVNGNGILEYLVPGITVLLAGGLNLDTEFSLYGMTGQQIYDAGCEASPIYNDGDGNGHSAGTDNSTSTYTVTSTTTTENNENPESPIQFECEIEGHKYDQNGNPLSDWQIGLMKVITQDEKTDIWDLSEDVTDNDGYYCLEWDGESRVLRGDTPTITDVPYDFTYHVYEKLVDNWNILSIEKGADIGNLAVVNGIDIRYDGSYVSTKIGETNGYIYANAAYHVDFYNIKNEEEAPVVDNVGNGGSSSGGSGTRVGDRNRGGGSSSNPEPKVLGEATSTMPLVAGDQVTVVPTGAPDTGAGGTSSNYSLSFSQILYISRRGF